MLIFRYNLIKVSSVSANDASIVATIINEIGYEIKKIENYFL